MLATLVPNIGSHFLECHYLLAVSSTDKKVHLEVHRVPKGLLYSFKMEITCKSFLIMIMNHNFISYEMAIRKWTIYGPYDIIWAIYIIWAIEFVPVMWYSYGSYRVLYYRSISYSHIIWGISYGTYHATHIIWFHSSRGPLLVSACGRYHMVHIIKSTSYGQYHMANNIWFLSNGPYDMDHIT